MTMVRAGFSQLMAVGAHALFVEWLDTFIRDMEYDKVFNMETSTKQMETEIQFAGLPPMPEKTENAPTEYRDGIQGGAINYVNLTYSLGCRTSWELLEDDQYGVIKQVPKAIARSAQYTQEAVPWNVFNLGFTSLTTTDGVSLFNTSHPLLGGPISTTLAPGLTNVIASAGTYPNRPSPDVDLSITAIQLMNNQFERMPDSQGIPIAVRPREILIPPELRFIATELLGSPGKPYTGDNEVNALLPLDLSFRVIHWFTSQSAWFAVADKANHQLKFFWRYKPDNAYDDDFDTGAMKTKSTMRFSAGATTWIGTWGSNGP